VFAVDVAALAVALLLSLLARFGSLATEIAGEWRGSTLGGRSYVAVVASLMVIWLVGIAARGAYRLRVLGSGAEEFKCVAWATVVTGGLVSIVCYLGRIEIARGFLAIAFPLGFVMLLIGRTATRLWLRRMRIQGRLSHRVVVVGTRTSAAELSTVLARDPAVGFRVVGQVVADESRPVTAYDSDEDVEAGAALDQRELLDRAGLTGLADELVRRHADTIVVAALGPHAARRLRLLSWALEGSGVDLVVAPSFTDVAGPRIHVRPVSGLPLLHVEEPTLRGARRAAKTAFDLAGATLLVVVGSPLLAAIAVAVRIDGSPVIFRQRRVGVGGAQFTCLKFRTMVPDAEAQLPQLAHRNDHDGVLFKLRDDPRVTRVGRWLRRLSLDELPQLFNVLAGQMSLVGPRPPLPAEVERYGRDAQRRLLVKPGLTGLWQVSGRSDLAWEDAVRLDLYYVENWSLSSDLLILVRTLLAVVGRKGAY